MIREVQNMALIFQKYGTKKKQHGTYFLENMAFIFSKTWQNKHFFF
jgi:hypothetical protein